MADRAGVQVGFLIDQFPQATVCLFLASSHNLSLARIGGQRQAMATAVES